MLFNSINFAIFLPIIFFLYWFVINKNLKLQNILLLVSSYFFYACWDWRFLFLLFFSTFLDYFTGIKMQESSNQKSKQFWFWLSIIINLGFLGVFKYYDFFAISFTVFSNPPLIVLFPFLVIIKEPALKRLPEVSNGISEYLTLILLFNSSARNLTSAIEFQFAI